MICLQEEIFMAYRLIAFDLDNTFLYDADSISQGNREALDDAAAEGVVTAVASGRVFTSLPACVVAVPSVDYAITSNGAAIYRLPKMEDRLDDTGEFSLQRCFQNSKCVRRLSLPADRVRAIMDLLDDYPSDRYPVSFETFIDGRAYGYADYMKRPSRYGLSQAYINYVRTTRTMVVDIRSFIRENADHLDGLDLQVGDPELVKELRQKLSREVPGIYITSSVPNRIEMSNENAGKASGIRYLMNIFGIRKEETAAFGDADNDIDMIRAAGTGIAMKNGTPGCRRAADYVTKDCRDDGFAWAVHHKLGITDRRAVKEKYMRAAVREAEKAAAIDEVPIGCVIVKDGKIIARGYNRRNKDRSTLSHAELNAIRSACRKISDWRLNGCTLYVTLEPCPMCAGAIVQSRIDNVVIGCRSDKSGSAGTVTDLFHVEGFDHHPEVEFGVLGEECSQILSTYFAGKRK